MLENNRSNDTFPLLKETTKSFAFSDFLKKARTAGCKSINANTALEKFTVIADDLEEIKKAGVVYINVRGASEK